MIVYRVTTGPLTREFLTLETAQYYSALNNNAEIFTDVRQDVVDENSELLNEVPAIKTRREKGELMLNIFSAKNEREDMTLFQALHLFHRIRHVEIPTMAILGYNQTHDFYNLIGSGGFECIYFCLRMMTPDNMTMPYHWLNQERINWFAIQVRDVIGKPLTDELDQAFGFVTL